MEWLAEECPDGKSHELDVCDVKATSENLFIYDRVFFFPPAFPPGSGRIVSRISTFAAP